MLGSFNREGNSIWYLGRPHRERAPQTYPEEGAKLMHRDYQGVSPKLMTTHIPLATDEEMEPLKELASARLERRVSDAEDRDLFMKMLGLKPS